MARNQNPRHLIIAGVNKSGTTTLFTALGLHPDICPSSIKETRFFLPERYGKNHESEGVYAQYFGVTDSHKWLLEATPGYLYGGTRLIKSIRQVTGNDTKIVVVLREPVTRAFSYFRNKKSMLEIPGTITFSDYIELCMELSAEDLGKEENNKYFGIEGGKYVNYLQCWLEEFGDDIEVVFFDNLVENQVLVISDVCMWLGLDVSHIIDQVKEGVNENRTTYTRHWYLQWAAVRIYRALEAFFRSHHKTKDIFRRFYYFLNSAKSSEEELDPADKDRLAEFYRPYNNRLADLLADRNPELPEWLERKN